MKTFYLCVHCPSLAFSYNPKPCSMWHVPCVWCQSSPSLAQILPRYWVTVTALTRDSLCSSECSTACRAFPCTSFPFSRTLALMSKHLSSAEDVISNQVDLLKTELPRSFFSCLLRIIFWRWFLSPVTPIMVIGNRVWSDSYRSRHHTVCQVRTGCHRGDGAANDPA